MDDDNDNMTTNVSGSRGSTTALPKFNHLYPISFFSQFIRFALHKGPCSRGNISLLTCATHNYGVLLLAFATCVLLLYEWHPTVLMCGLPICLLGCRRFRLWWLHNWLPLCSILIKFVAAGPHYFQGLLLEPLVGPTCNSTCHHLPGEHCVCP